MTSGEQHIFKVEHQPPDRLADLYGLDDAKQVVGDIVQGCVHADFVQRFGGNPTTGIFLDGGPGTGKSTLVRALTHELGEQTGEGADLLTITASAFAHVSNPEQTIEAVFEQMRLYEGWGVVFFNEADGLFRQDAGLTAIWKEKLEVGANNSKLLLAAATNNINVIDPAIFAPHRFNVRLHLDSPQPRVVAQILQRLMSESMYGDSRLPVFAKDIDVQTALDNAPRFSGSNLVEIVRRAKGTQITRAIPTGQQPSQVGQNDLDKIIQKYISERPS